MGEVNYAPLIDDMVWSYSRIKAFEDCPYRWYLKYIKKFHGKDMFFSSYGKDHRTEIVGLAPLVVQHLPGFLKENRNHHLYLN